MAISDADQDASSIGPVEPTSPETQQAARLTVCRNARDRDDAELLLDMLGLGRKAAAAEESDGGCPVCGKALPLFALSPKCGLKGTCSKQCKAVLYRGEGAR